MSVIMSPLLVFLRMKSYLSQQEPIHYKQYGGQVMVSLWKVTPLTFCVLDHKQVVERNVTRFNQNAFSLYQLLPSTEYICCVLEYSVDGAVIKVCKNTKTLPQAPRRKNSFSAVAEQCATFLIFIMILVSLTVYIYTSIRHPYMVSTSLAAHNIRKQPTVNIQTTKLPVCKLIHARVHSVTNDTGH